MYQDQRESLLAKCIAADPHHGLIWQTVTKDPANVDKDLRVLLDLAADKVEELNPPPATI